MIAPLLLYTDGACLGSRCHCIRPQKSRAYLDLTNHECCIGNRNVAKGACLAGWGVVVLLGSDPADIDGTRTPAALAELCGPVISNPSQDGYLGAEFGSNNTAELSAIGEALLWLQRLLDVDETQTPLIFNKVVIRYDSEYAAKSITGEFNGKKNLILIQRIREIYRKVNSKLCAYYKRRHMPFDSISFIHVKGHSGQRWNNRADELANKGLKGELLTSPIVSLHSSVVRETQADVGAGARVEEKKIYENNREDIIQLSDDSDVSISEDVMVRNQPDGTKKIEYTTAILDRYVMQAMDLAYRGEKNVPLDMFMQFLIDFKDAIQKDSRKIEVVSKCKPHTSSGDITGVKRDRDSQHSRVI